ncbi:EF-Tu/IF-2/RF-3 family GTPase [Desulfosporosinus sp. SB140]|uniref:EF-Tu/IF-2/RF-3 family GTPase n=1 Tax=Desulfosporosinus paludis TaxID=3115649 RepID=UPI00388E1458
MSNSLAFKMFVEDIFEIKNRGIVVTGVVKSGFISSGDVIEVIGNYKETAHVLAIEKDRNIISEAFEGDSIGLLLRNISCEHIAIGDLLLKYSDKLSDSNKEFDKNISMSLNITKTDFSGLVKKLIAKMRFRIIQSSGSYPNFYAMQCIRDEDEKFAIGCLFEERTLSRNDLDMLYELEDRNFLVFSYADLPKDKLIDRYGQEIDIICGDEFARMVSKYLGINIR